MNKIKNSVKNLSKITLKISTIADFVYFQQFKTYLLVVFLLEK